MSMSRQQKQNTEVGTFRELKDLVERSASRDIIARTLPRGMNVDAWISGALVAVRKTEDIQYATPKSTVGAIITAASLGLQLEGVLGQAYFTAFKKQDRTVTPWRTIEVQTQLQIGYLGLIQIAWRNAEVQDLCARTICQNDDFQFKFGSNAGQEHTWDHRLPRGPIVAVYAEIRYKDGYYSFSDPYSVEEIEKVRARALEDKNIKIEERNGELVYLKYSKKYDKYEEMSEYQKSRTPWIAYYKAMAMKTAVRWASKFWRIGTDFERAASLIGMDDRGVSQKMEEVAAQYMADASAARRTMIPGAGGSGTDATDGPDLAQPLVRPFDGAKGRALKDRMLAEAAGPPPDPKPVPAVPSPERPQMPSPQPDGIPAAAGRVLPPATGGGSAKAGAMEAGKHSKTLPDKKQMPRDEEAEILDRELAEARAYHAERHKHDHEYDDLLDDE